MHHRAKTISKLYISHHFISTLVRASPIRRTKNIAIKIKFVSKKFTYHVKNLVISATIL